MDVEKINNLSPINAISTKLNNGEDYTQNRTAVNDKENTKTVSLDLDNSEVIDLHGRQTSHKDRVDDLRSQEKKLYDTIRQANQKLLDNQTKFEFSVHEDTKRISIKVINKKSNEVIREIPPERVLDMVAKMVDMSGLIVDESL